MSNCIVKLPSVESFGRLTPDKWLAMKNLELACTPQHPLFGNKQPKQTGTHWIVFMKEALDEIPQD